MFLVIDITPTFKPTTQGFDIHRDSPWIGIAAFALFFGASLIFAVKGGGQWNLGKFQFWLAQAVFVPLFALLTLCCYAHPEQLDNNPDGWMSDLRPIWPVAAIADICLVAWVLSEKQDHAAQALQYMRIANQLLAEGKIEEADAAYAKGQWILENKCKRR
jgi:hypothetical protein